jgi:hypothetical protein
MTLAACSQVELSKCTALACYGRFMHKMFMKLRPAGANIIKLFTGVIYECS